MDGTLFENNTAKYGGAISARLGTNVTVKNATFNANNAKDATANSGSDHGGGAVYSDFATISIQNTSFNGCATDNRGGALLLHSCTTTVFSSTFDGKNAVSRSAAASNAANGGAIYASAGTLNVTSSAFEGNFATSGGAVSAEKNATATLDNITFKENSATYGGAVYAVRSLIEVKGNNTVFSKNSATRGGAIYLTNQEVNGVKVGAVLTMEGGSFEYNTALEGGAVSIRSECDATFKTTNFRNNTAEGVVDAADGNGEGGGAIYVGWAKLTLDGVTMNANKAVSGFGGYYRTSSGGGLTTSNRYV